MNALTFADELQKSGHSTQADEHTAEQINAAREVLFRGLELLFELKDGSYSRATSESGSSIGDHYGQAIQHFRSFIEGYHAGEIRYSAGEPSGRLRSDVLYASIATCDVLSALKRYQADNFSRECRVVRDQLENRGELSSVASTLSNELAYCTANASGQYAAIRGICEQVESLTLPGFGHTRSFRDDLATSISEPDFIE